MITILRLEEGGVGQVVGHLGSSSEARVTGA